MARYKLTLICERQASDDVIPLEYVMSIPLELKQNMTSSQLLSNLGLNIKLYQIDELHFWKEGRILKPEETLPEHSGGRLSVKHDSDTSCLSSILSRLRDYIPNDAKPELRCFYVQEGVGSRKFRIPTGVSIQAIRNYL